MGNPLRCSAVSIRVEAHRAAGGFDPSLPLRRGLGLLAQGLAVLEGRLAGGAHRQGPVARPSETHRFKTGRADLDENSANARDPVPGGPGGTSRSAITCVARRTVGWPGRS